MKSFCTDPPSSLCYFLFLCEHLFSSMLFFFVIHVAFTPTNAGEDVQAAKINLLVSCCVVNFLV